MNDHVFVSTVRFPDGPTALFETNGPTEQDEEMLIRRLPKPTSAVPCKLPVKLRMLSGSPRAVLRQLDITGAVLQVEYALPNEGVAWLSLPCPAGEMEVPARVVGGVRPHPEAPWVVELRFEVATPELRSGLAGLVQALRRRQRERNTR